MLKVLQINLHKNKEASVELLQNLEGGNYDVALVQEPWIGSGNVVSGLDSPAYFVYYPNAVNRVRAVVLVKKSIRSYINTNFSTDDLTTVAIMNGKNQILLLGSCYMAHERKAPPDELHRLVKEAERRKQGLVIGSDANAHHTLWGSSDTNDRGESLFNFILQSSIEVANRGEEPTYVGPTSKNVLDVTLFTSSSTRVEDWRVLQLPSLSDHKYIKFEIAFSPKVKSAILRNPRNTNWETFRKLLLLQRLRPGKYGSCVELEENVRVVTDALNKAYHTACTPVRMKRRPKPPWWNKELGSHRRNVLEFYKLARKADNESCWDEYNDLRRTYKKEVRRAKRESWKDFCGSIESTNEAARLRKLLSKHPTTPNLIRKLNGDWTNNCEESLQDLVNTHFPGCKDYLGHELVSDNSVDIPEDLITKEKIEWAINTFDPFKAPGIDGIFPAMLQKMSKLLVPWLKAIFTGCLRFGYVPTLWREARVVFIPKAGKSNPLLSKEYRPISLTSFFLKTLEKILDAHIREKCMPDLMSKAQHAYTKGRSTETALHSLVSSIEKALEFKEYALGVFLDISGAFNNVSREAILKGLNTTNTEPAVYSWIKNLLSSRVIRAEWNEAKLTKLACEGTPQGGVLSPLLWLLTVNGVLKKFESTASKLVAYADDIAIVVTGKYLDTVSNIMNNTLTEVHQWATQAGLGVNADKTDMVLFTRRYKITAWIPPKLNDVVLTLKDSTKYLGVILDSKLSWKFNVLERKKKASNALYACKRMLGITWGLSPSIMHWCYSSIVKPILLYGALVWWTALKKTTYKTHMEGIQRLGALCTTGAMRTTPTAALERILNLPPIDIAAECLAAKSAVRLRAIGEFTCRAFGHSSIGMSYRSDSDYMTPKCNWVKKFRTIIEDEGWKRGLKPNHNTFNIFTDGSKMIDGTGAGVYCVELGIRQPYKLPDHCSIFQAEVFAVRKAAEVALAKTTTNSRINLYVDSQAAIKAISSYDISSKNVLKSRAAIERLTADRRLYIYWVPGHRGIEGNEIVDEIAKSAVHIPLEHENDVLKPLKTIYNEIDEDMRRRIDGRWYSLTTCKTARVMCTQTADRYAKFILALSRKESRTIIGILTGHNLLAAHAYKIGITNNDNCRFCNELEERETLEHLLCSCPALARTRLKCLGALQYEKLENLSGTEPLSLLRFAKDAGLLQEAYYKGT